MTQNIELEQKLRSLTINRSDAETNATQGSWPSAKRGGSLWLKLLLLLTVLGGAGGYLFERNTGGLTAWASQYTQKTVAEKEPVKAPTTPSKSQPETPVAKMMQAATSAEPSVVGSGHVVAFNELAVGARINGTVKNINVEAGQKVAAGDILIQLDDTDARLALDVARATEAATAAVVAQARAAVSVAAAPVERLKVLVSKGAASTAQLQDATLNLDQLQQSVEVARRQQELATLKTDQARNIVELYTIRAPFDAIVVDRSAVPGQLIAEMGQAGPDDTVLLTLIDTSALFVDVDVAERNVAQLQANMPAEVRLDAYPDRHLNAHVHSITPRVSLEKGTVTVRLKLEPADLGGVLTNMAAKVTFGQVRKIALSTLK